MEKSKKRNIPFSGKSFRQLFKKGPEPTVLLDEEGRIQDLNRRFEEVFGYELEEVKGKGINSLIVPERLIDEAEGLDQKSKQGYLNHETVREGKEGEIPVSVSAIPITVEEETYLKVTYRDITGRKKARQKLKESEQRYRNYFEELGDAVYITKVGGEEHGRILDANQAAEEQSGYSKEELIGMNIEEDIVVEGSETMDLETADKMLKKGETITFTEQKRRKDGTEYWTEVLVTPIEHKGEEASLSINRDVTERKQATQALNEERDKLKNLHDAVDKLQQQDTEEDVLDTAVDVAETMLDFQICAIDLREGEYLIPKANSTGVDPDETIRSKIGEGIGGKTFQKGETIWGEDVRNHPEAKPTNEDFRAFISVPIGEIGILQVISKEITSFEEEDVELAEILAGHLREELNRVRLEEELKHQAIRDPLTDLYNRRYFNETLGKEAQQAERYDKPLAFLMIDVNRFKEINDRYSHQTGDKVLQEVADLLEENFRSADTVVRYGGDEFLVMMPETNGGVTNTVDRLKEKLDTWNKRSDLLDFPLTLAMGISHWSPDQDRVVEDALNEADKKMYEDKRENR